MNHKFHHLMNGVLHRNHVHNCIIGLKTAYGGIIHPECYSYLGMVYHANKIHSNMLDQIYEIRHIIKKSMSSK
jgi:hypothetical protein